MNTSRVLAFLLLATCPVWAQDRVFNTHTVLGLGQAAGARIAPDGSRIAVLTRRPRTETDADGGARTTLGVIPFAGGELRPYITEGSISGLLWSADSKALHFKSKRGESKLNRVFRLPIDGGEAQVLFEPVRSVLDFAIRADGHAAAYTCLEAEDADRKKQSSLGFDREVVDEEIRGVELHWIDLTTGDDRVLAVDGAPWEMAFSPDGTHLAVWVSPLPTTDHRYMYRRMRIMNLETGGSVKVANPGKVGAFAWSPNGKRIAMISGRVLQDPKESSIAIVDAATGALRFLTPANYEGHIEHLAWRSNSDLCLIAAEGCGSVMTIQSVDNPQQRTVVNLPAELVLGAFSMDGAAERLALVAQSATHPPEVFALGGEDGLRRLTVTNPELSEHRFAKQEVRRFTARDGQEIGGVLIWPLDYRDGTRYPLILVVHGGPEARDANGWLTNYSRPGQVAAARGFFVFHINYRGSTGRGVAFSRLDQGRMAREEFDDLVDGIESLVQAGLVDKKRVGITGGSYGGYASAWAATKLSDHFAASVMFVGISEQISKVLTTDIPDESFHSHWNKRLWDDWQDFLEASPIYHVKNAKTPILIGHGKEDPRVPVAQSRELYQALKIRGGVPVRLVLYPGEGHGNRRRASQLDYGLRQVRWFEHFLKRGMTDLPPNKINYDQD